MWYTYFNPKVGGKLPKDSKRKRQLRRVRRERSLAYQFAKIAVQQRDHARKVAGVLEEELIRREAQETGKPALTITKVEEPGVENNDHADTPPAVAGSREDDLVDVPAES